MLISQIIVMCAHETGRKIAESSCENDVFSISQTFCHDLYYSVVSILCPASFQSIFGTVSFVTHKIMHKNEDTIRKTK